MGFLLTAADLNGLFDEVTRSLCDHLTDRSEVLPRESRWIELAADNAESLLQKWIEEQLLIYETEGTFSRHSESSVTEGRQGGFSVRGHLHGEPCDPIRHQRRSNIPTRPFPRPRLRQVAEGWQVEVELAPAPTDAAESEVDEDPLAAAGGLAGG